MTTAADSPETRILQRVREVLVAVATDTATPPGMRHPLSDRTAQAISDCLTLISARERELTDAHKPGDPRFEERMLRMVRRALTDVAKDTSAPPGTAHPLSADTIQAIRECLGLIAGRERDLAQAAGRPSQARPEFIDEPKKTQVVTIHKKKPGSDSVH